MLILFSFPIFDLELLLSWSQHLAFRLCSLYPKALQAGHLGLDLEIANPVCMAIDVVDLGSPGREKRTNIQRPKAVAGEEGLTTK